jgi:predicted acylesterase/phospholipase RssA
MNKLINDLLTLIWVYLSNNYLILLTAPLILLLFRREIIFLLKRAWKFLNQFYFWMFKAFSWRLTVPMLLTIGLYFLIFIPAFLYQVFVAPDIGVILDRTNAITILLSIVLWFLRLVVICGATLITLGFFALGITLCNIVAVKLYRRRRKKYHPVQPLLLQPVSPSVSSINKPGNPLQDFQRIGIILSGGGAKGAYQAGAMKAIYEFLEAHEAHHKVKMIAGTSIGSWNALFWLANLVAEGEGRHSHLEEWWCNLNVGNLVEPSLGFPFYGNFMLSSEPWRDQFNAIFNNGEVTKRLESHLIRPDEPGNIHFYFTQTNVEQGRLEYTSNYSERGSRVNEQSLHLAASVEEVGNAVFSSMGLPLAFEYTKVPKQDDENAYDYFEDGGVIDNLPIRFGTEVEACDLLFVLSLNASFERSINKTSVLKRLFRVLDIRQGVLEQNSFKMVELYNELVRLRARVDNCEQVLELVYANLLRGDKTLPETVASLNVLETNLPFIRETSINEKADSALLSKQKRPEVRVFAVCPGPNPLISTAEFWKKEAAAQAFALMNKAVRKQLDENFTEIIATNRACMVKVDNKGAVTVTNIF